MFQTSYVFQGEGDNEGKEEEEEDDENVEEEEQEYSDDGDYNQVCLFTLYPLSVSACSKCIVASGKKISSLSFGMRMNGI